MLDNEGFSMCKFIICALKFLVHMICCVVLNFRSYAQLCRLNRDNGVLCDRNMHVKLTEKLFRTVVMPSMLYGAETWALRWMCAVTETNMIRKELVRGTVTWHHYWQRRSLS